MDLINLLSEFVNFGAAGLMGAMWLWERKLSRQREQQLHEAHQRIGRDEQKLEQFTQVVERNSSAFSRFSESHRQTNETIRELIREYHHVHSH